MSDLMQQLHSAVAQQLQSPQTRYVKGTRDRLCKLGLSEQDAISQIADCLGDVLERMLIEHQAFDEKRYRQLLDALPWPHDVDACEAESNTLPL